MQTLRLLAVYAGLAAALPGAGWLAAQPATATDAPRPAALAKLNTIGSTARRRLAQFEAIIAPQPADESRAGDDPPPWDEAIDLVEDLLATAGDQLVEAAEPGRFLSLREHCHALIAALPPEGLEAYRQRMDAVARQLYEQGRDSGDTEPLRRLTADYFASSWGDDSLLLLGDLALERGDTAAARRFWRRITPAASDPLGRPLAWSLRGVDVPKHVAQIEAAVRSATPWGAAVYPDTDLPLGPVLARLALASLYERDLAAARTYANLLTVLAPNATGKLAGRDGRLDATLAKLIDDAPSWRGTSETPLGPLSARLWRRPFEEPAAAPPSPVRQRAVIIGGRLRVAPQRPAPPPLPNCLPTAAERVVVFRDGAALRAVDFLTGEPALAPKGALHRPDGAGADPQVAAARLRGALLGQGLVIRGGRRVVAVSLPSNEPMPVRRGLLLARVTAGRDALHKQGLGLHAFDLRREGLESPVVGPTAAPWRLGGAPAVDATRVYLPLVTDDVAPRVALACYSLATGRELWRTPVATGAARATYGPAPAMPVLATLSGDTLYLNTNLGAVASLDKRDGAVRWARQYDRRDDSATSRQPTAAPDAAPCLVHRGRVFVAPRDAATTFALDAATGRVLWVADELGEAPYLLGVSDGTLVVGGRQLRGVDAEDGTIKYAWPESPKAGVRGMGRGCLVAGEAFWPTRTRLFVFDAERGVQTRPSIDIADLGGTGANVVPAHGCLIAAGANAMTVLGPFGQQPDNDQPLLSLAPRP